MSSDFVCAQRLWLSSETLVEFRDYGYIQRLQCLNTFVVFRDLGSVQRLRSSSETFVEFGDFGLVQ